MRKLLFFLFIGISLKCFSQGPCTPPVVTTTPSIKFCGGGQVLLSAMASGIGPFSFRWSPSGKTTDTITVAPNVPSTYTVTVKNSCGDSTIKSITVTPDFPIMYACCNTAIGVGHSTTLEAGSNSVSYTWSPPVTCLNPPLCDSVKATPTVTTTYTVTGTDSAGCSVSELITIVVGSAGVSSIVQNNIVNIYPNPSSTEFTVDLPTKSLLNVCDITGRILFSEMEKPGIITFGKELNPGIYFLFINGKPGGKIVKL